MTDPVPVLPVELASLVADWVRCSKLYEAIQPEPEIFAAPPAGGDPRFASAIQLKCPNPVGLAMLAQLQLMLSLKQVRVVHGSNGSQIGHSPPSPHTYQTAPHGSARQ
jgi:hypothetical protein